MLLGYGAESEVLFQFRSVQGGSDRQDGLGLRAECVRRQAGRYQSWGFGLQLIEEIAHTGGVRQRDVDCGASVAVVDLGYQEVGAAGSVEGREQEGDVSLGAGNGSAAGNCCALRQFGDPGGDGDTGGEQSVGCGGGGYGGLAAGEGGYGAQYREGLRGGHRRYAGDGGVDDGLVESGAGGIQVSGEGLEEEGCEEFRFEGVGAELETCYGGGELALQSEWVHGWSRLEGLVDSVHIETG
ncbi:hypothetical protein [Nocardia huaxiensis]|uniref:hypothetical protein n=1 Tax=Nocardia huaxiensis TaxID=2755382 RepID=UPI001E464A90|nr:hypothetical protein [Nocardia huaxiensis]UFS99607.1 hypothetical protein LPY97_17820 [Nocardia huaxiensis]